LIGEIFPAKGETAARFNYALSSHSRTNEL